MAIDAALPLEGLRHNIDSEMRFPTRAMSRMPFMPVGFIDHLQALGGESRRQLLCDHVAHRHGGALEHVAKKWKPDVGEDGARGQGRTVCQRCSLDRRE